MGVQYTSYFHLMSTSLSFIYSYLLYAFYIHYMIVIEHLCNNYTFMLFHVTLYYCILPVSYNKLYCNENGSIKKSLSW